ncbi:hypothetical protein DSM107010_41250 [Chroococcidiopsis cubana SAG 39.79]|uniref:Antirepressor protein C-terminal domain-containing protein n=1 Tax=Chroococcidiopsis cubana SAG 39.79 TaxID=388085 RepID=A0AB37UG31_9CYAN|nr:Rha family transcriptional regulator [Chroococcidiopsis cubana]RUT10558.1 hypothetical protein DSM107010_41250 [Chroococcidiopsis cubana SAG 39.79]
MTNLTVIERDGILVVDSRLVAQRLGIEHHTLLKTIDKYLARLEAKSPVRFEVDVVKRPQGGGSPTRYALLDERQATLLMTYSRNTEQVLDCKDALVDAFERAKQIVKQGISAQNPETKRMKLELELIRAKQHYQDTGHAIALSTSPAMLQWLRGETPPPPKVEYRERFVDPATRREIGSSSGRSLTQLVTDAGLNPKSSKDRQKVKKILKCLGFDYDKMQCWVNASYLREYPVLDDDTYRVVLKEVLAEVTQSESQPNLFVHSLQRSSFTPSSAPDCLEREP